jgi:hypothetical protein
MRRGAATGRSEHTQRVTGSDGSGAVGNFASAIALGMTSHPRHPGYAAKVASLSRKHEYKLRWPLPQHMSKACNCRVQSAKPDVLRIRGRLRRQKLVGRCGAHLALRMPIPPLIGNPARMNEEHSVFSHHV